MKKILKKLYNYLLIIIKIDFFIGIWGLLAEIYHKNNRVGKFLVNKKNKVINNFLVTKYKYVFDEEKKFSNKNISLQSTIWVFWWQGIEEMPEVVELCWKSKQKHLNNHKIQLITKDNFFEFIDVPQYLLDKLKFQQINIANFADVYRTMLLAKYGGIWMDATIFQVSKIDSIMYNYPFVSAKRNKKDTIILYPANSRWGTYFLAAGEDNELMYYVSKILLNYWSEYNIIIDYGLIDYVICACMDMNNNIKEIINKSPLFCEKIHELQKVLNDEYLVSKYKEIIKDNPLFKLTYKLKFNIKTSDEKKTFYGYIKEENNTKI